MIVPITATEACAFVQGRHYSGSAVPGTIRFGWAIDGELAGVSIYDPGVHAMRQGVYGADHYRHVLHHHRLAVDESAPRNTASQFIGACLRHLRVERPDIWAIVTYADLCQGHDGGIYRATNAVFTGVQARGNLKFRTQEGVIVTTQSLSRYGDWPTRRREAAARGWTEIRCKGKYRYVYLLGTAKQRRGRPTMLWPTLPYPT